MRSTVMAMVAGAEVWVASATVKVKESGPW